MFSSLMSFAQTTMNYGYDPNSMGAYHTTHDSGMSAAMVVVSLLFGLVIYVVTAFVLGKVFLKAKRPMWPAFVPIYNSWVLYEISGKPGWFAILSIIPVVGTVLFILAMLELAKRFKRSTVFAVFGLILFTLIGYIILAFGKDEYSDPESPSTPTAPQAGPIAPSSTTPPAVPKPPVASPSRSRTLVQ